MDVPGFASTTPPPPQPDPDVDPADEARGSTREHFKTARPTEQDELDALDPDYREVD